MATSTNQHIQPRMTKAPLSHECASVVSPTTKKQQQSQPKAAPVRRRSPPPQLKLCSLRRAYARRGCPASVLEVTNGSLVGAPRRRVALIDHSEEQDDDDDDDEEVAVAAVVEEDCSSSDDEDDALSTVSFTSSAAETSSSSSPSGSSQQQRRLRFASHTAVVEIPHFGQYSPQQHKAMWNGTQSIKQMARINTVEYQYDGWTVEAACEEDQFVVVRGVPVHPAHATRSTTIASRYYS